MAETDDKAYRDGKTEKGRAREREREKGTAARRTHRRHAETGDTATTVNDGRATARGGPPPQPYRVDRNTDGERAEKGRVAMRIERARYNEDQ